MDEFDSCCRGNLKSKGKGWHFPPEDDNPGFETFKCIVCGKLWFKDDETGKYYAHRRKWVLDN